MHFLVFYSNFCGIPFLLIVMSSFSEQMDLFSGGWNLQVYFMPLWNQLCVCGYLLFLLSIREGSLNKPDAFGPEIVH